MFFSIITQNLNWGNLTTNLATFKRWDGVKIKNFDITDGSLRNPIFSVGSQQTNIQGDRLKRGTLDNLQI